MKSIKKYQVCIYHQLLLYKTCSIKKIFDYEISIECFFLKKTLKNSKYVYIINNYCIKHVPLKKIFDIEISFESFKLFSEK